MDNIGYVANYVKIIQSLEKQLADLLDYNLKMVKSYTDILNEVITERDLLLEQVKQLKDKHEHLR
jgi:uncharacterized coiled-coil DUF342 family protein